MPRFNTLEVLALLLPVALHGCSSSIDARKQASVRSESAQQIAGARSTEFALGRSAVLLTGADEVDHLHLSKGEVQGVFRRRGQVCRTVGGCAAVPIDARGYWLTAGHCARSGAVLLVVPSNGLEERAVAARLVWHDKAPGHDLALLQAPLPEGVIPAEVASDVRMSARVFCVGSGIGSDRFSAGRVVGVGGSTDGSLVWLEHDAPLSAGDSGGPAFYQDGLLAGINFEAGESLTGDKVRATAIQPNMQSIRLLIDEDWNSKKRAEPDAEIGTVNVISGRQ